MQQVEVTDLSFDSELKSTCYNWFVVGVGLESRTDYVLTCLKNATITAGHALVLVFPDAVDTNKERVTKICDKIRDMFVDVHIEFVDTSSQYAIWKLLRQRFANMRDLKILVDYSSMSRAWYAALLWWFWENAETHPGVQLDFIYALGRYSKDIAEKDVVIGDIEIAPGCAGEMFRQARTVAVFGLGFYGCMSLCACEQIEPDVLYTISTPENPIEDFRVEDQLGNRELVERAAKSFKLSVASVESAYRYLSEISTVHLNRGDEVILVPMGPKTHVLASILVSLANRRVCTLRVRHKLYDSNVEALGPLVATRIKFVSVAT